MPIICTPTEIGLYFATKGIDDNKKINKLTKEGKIEEIVALESVYKFFIKDEIIYYNALDYVGMYDINTKANEKIRATSRIIDGLFTVYNNHLVYSNAAETEYGTFAFNMETKEEIKIDREDAVFIIFIGDIMYTGEKFKKIPKKII